MDKETRMFALMSAWESSGLTRQEFCEREGLKLSNFSYWRTRYRQSLSSNKSEGFVKVEPSLSTGIELIYPNGVKVVLPKTINVSQIATLIKLI